MTTYPIGFLRPKAGGMPRNGLIGEWLFSGNANDTSGNGNNGTITGATLTTDRHGSSNSAYLFSGSAQYIEIGDKYDLLLKDRAYSLWFNLSTLGSTSSIFGILSKAILASSIGRWAIYLSGNRISSLIQGGSGNFVSRYEPQVSVSTWHHVVVNVDRSGNMALYLDDTLRDTDDISSTVAENLNTSNTLRFGCFNDLAGNPGAFFPGKIDDIRIYDRLLTATEITTLYNE